MLEKATLELGTFFSRSEGLPEDVEHDPRWEPSLVESVGKVESSQSMLEWCYEQESVYHAI